MKTGFGTARWDSLLPLGTIAIFGILAIPVALGVVDFGLEGGGEERFKTIYTDIGIQTTAGIFAIVISLSLVAIQFAAQEYSHRIMEYYIKSSVFWSTIAVYLGLMIAAIFLQARSTDADNPRVVALALLGSVLALVLLVPHFIVTAAYLKPEFIIEKLVRRITLRYLASVEQRGAEAITGTSSDRLLPIIEIAERSIERGDVATANNAIAKIVERYEAAVTNGTPKTATNAGLVGYFSTDLNRIGRKAISEADEEPVAVQVIRAIAGLARPGQPGDTGALPQVTSTIDGLLFAAVRHQQEGTIGAGIDALSTLYVEADSDVRGLIADSFGALIPRLAKEGHQILSERLVTLLENMIAAEHPGEAGHSRLLELLESIGRESALNRMVRVVRIAAISMSTIGIDCAESHPETAKSIVLGMLRIERSLDPSDADAVAAVGFARSEVERSSGSQAAPDGTEGGDGFSDLWNEPE